jgi:hypothetical protein
MRDKVITNLQRLPEMEHTPKTIVAGVTSHILGFKTKPQMKTVSDASGVSVLSIHKLVMKL